MFQGLGYSVDSQTALSCEFLQSLLLLMVELEWRVTLSCLNHFVLQTELE